MITVKMITGEFIRLNLYDFECSVCSDGSTSIRIMGERYIDGSDVSYIHIEEEVSDEMEEFIDFANRILFGGNCQNAD